MIGSCSGRSWCHGDISSNNSRYLRGKSTGPLSWFACRSRTLRGAGCLTRATEETHPSHPPGQVSPLSLRHCISTYSTVKDRLCLRKLWPQPDLPSQNVPARAAPTNAEQHSPAPSPCHTRPRLQCRQTPNPQKTKATNNTGPSVTAAETSEQSPRGTAHGKLAHLH